MVQLLLRRPLDPHWIVVWGSVMGIKPNGRVVSSKSRSVLGHRLNCKCEGGMEVEDPEWN